MTKIQTLTEKSINMSEDAAITVASTPDVDVDDYDII